MDATKLANDLLDFVNPFGHDADAFAKTICQGHKTLQQSVMRLFMRTIAQMAEVPPDMRNEATVALAKEIVKLADEHPLPMI